MSKPFSPDISRYQQLVPYFQDFYSLNKEKNKKFSYQYLANHLGWTAPYLNDIFKGRKKLSINRALEFIEYLELKNLAAERFLILYLADSDAGFAHSKIKQSSLSSKDDAMKLSTYTLEEHKEKFETIFDFYILLYIHYNNGAWNPSKFLEQVTLTRKPSPKKLEQLVGKLIQQKRLEYNLETQVYKVQQNHELLHHDRATPDQEAIRKEITRSAKECAGNFLDYLENPIIGKSSYVHGVISLNEEMYLDVQSRIAALHNYVMGLSEKAQELFDNETNGIASTESRVWQYQFNIFSLFRKQELSEEAHERSDDRSIIHFGARKFD